MRACVAILVVVIAALLGVPGVGVASDVVGTAGYVPAAGPVIAGQRLVYVPSDQPSSGPVRIVAAAGAGVTELARLPGEPARTDGGTFTARAVQAAIAASSTTLAATVTTVFDLANGRSGDVGQQLTRTWAGHLGGPLAAVSAVCRGPQELVYPSVDGQRVATQGTACGPLAVLDVGDGSRRPLPVAATGLVELAGPLTAWLEPANPAPGGGGAAAVVVDAAGRELLRVPVASVGEATGSRWTRTARSRSTVPWPVIRRTRSRSRLLRRPSLPRGSSRCRAAPSCPAPVWRNGAWRSCVSRAAPAR